MKQFVYFQETDGGMIDLSISKSDDLSVLPGWMRADNRADDAGIAKWMDTAEIGDKYDHRLGYLVRLGDIMYAG